MNKIEDDLEELKGPDDRTLSIFDDLFSIEPANGSGFICTDLERPDAPLKYVFTNISDLMSFLQIHREILLGATNDPIGPTPSLQMGTLGDGQPYYMDDGGYYTLRDGKKHYGKIGDLR